MIQKYCWVCGRYADFYGEWSPGNSFFVVSFVGWIDGESQWSMKQDFWGLLKKTNLRTDSQRWFFGRIDCMSFKILKKNLQYNLSLMENHFTSTLFLFSSSQILFPIFATITMKFIQIWRVMKKKKGLRNQKTSIVVNYSIWKLKVGLNVIQQEWRVKLWLGIKLSQLKKCLNKKKQRFKSNDRNQATAHKNQKGILGIYWQLFADSLKYFHFSLLFENSHYQ